MGRRNLVLVAIAIALVAVLALSAWALDCFSVIGLEKLSANPQILASGILPRLKSTSQNFTNKLENILAGAGSRKADWVDKITNAMNKGAEIYSRKVFDMFATMEHWAISAQQFLDSWNYGDLTLSANTKDKINSLIKNHFQRLSEILSSINRGGGAR